MIGTFSRKIVQYGWHMLLVVIIFDQTGQTVPTLNLSSLTCSQPGICHQSRHMSPIPAYVTNPGICCQSVVSVLLVPLVSITSLTVLSSYANILVFIYCGNNQFLKKLMIVMTLNLHCSWTNLQAGYATA